MKGRVIAVREAESGARIVASNHECNAGSQYTRAESFTLDPEDTTLCKLNNSHDIAEVLRVQRSFGVWGDVTVFPVSFIKKQRFTGKTLTIQYKQYKSSQVERLIICLCLYIRQGKCTCAYLVLNAVAATNLAVAGRGAVALLGVVVEHDGG
ncbi:hypothetical protein BDR04DRAFT_1104227, partial [Suillus decipiens]